VTDRNLKISKIRNFENLRPLLIFFYSRLARQGSDNEVALDIGTIAAAGERCIDKVKYFQCFNQIVIDKNILL